MTEVLPPPPAYIDHDTVVRRLSMRTAISLMDDAMRKFSGGHVDQPLRTIIRPGSTPALLGTMPCYVGGDGLTGFGVKTMMLKPDNPSRNLPLHIGTITVFSEDTGAPLAIIDASAVTAIRTAAVSAVATRALARDDAGDLAILGAGVQARSHLRAMAEVRDLRRVRLWNRTPERAQAYRDWAASWLPIPVEVMPDPASALNGADLVCSTMATRDPIVEAEFLTEGAHVNLVGGSFADAREFSSAAVARARIFFDSRTSALAESGDIRNALQDGLISEDDLLAEIGTVLLGGNAGRTDRTQITLYKSLGLAVQDIICGLHLAASRPSISGHP